MRKISIRDEFSKTPGHRSSDDGAFSGDDFFSQVLRPEYIKAREQQEQLLVDLDGTAGYATSFLEASFGGLAREFPVEDVLNNIKLKCEEEPYLFDEIQSYIKNARNPETRK